MTCILYTVFITYEITRQTKSYCKKTKSTGFLKLFDLPIYLLLGLAMDTM